jgi:hypothetical protein
MIINFLANDSDSKRSDISVIEHWRTILRKLQEECPADRAFYDWAEETWKIKPLKSSILHNYISGIEVDDTFYTMLLLKFPK